MDPKTPRRHEHTELSPALARDIRRLKRAAPLLAVLALLAAAYLVFLYPSGVAMAPQAAWKRAIAPAWRFGLSPQTVSFQSSDGIPLKAWWERAWSVPEPKGTVILVHGSQSNKTGMGYVAARLLARGVSVLVPDLRGHGESGGSYSTFDYKEALDVEAAVKWARTHPSGGRIALLGHSSGAVAVLLAASRTPDLAAVIADSAYLDKEDVLAREREVLSHLDPKLSVSLADRMRLTLFMTPGFAWMSRAAFRIRAGVAFDAPDGYVRDAVRRIDRTPVLYLASAHDSVVPRAVTEELLRLTASPRKQLSILPGTFHSAIGGDPRGYIEVVSAFLDGAMGTPPIAPPAAAEQ